MTELLSQFPIWLERLFLFLDEWLYLAVLVLVLIPSWISARMNVIRLHDTGGSHERDAQIFKERMLRIVLLVWFIVGAIFVYGVGYPMFFHHVRVWSDCICSEDLARN
jgi:cytochrome c biogenesis factor